MLLTIENLEKELKEGKIVAIKGIGGTHLVVDAYNDDAITELRNRLNRPNQAFAVMCKDLKSLQKYAELTQKEIETIKIPSKFSYKLIDEELKKVELEKNIILRLLKSDGKLYIDLRKYYKNYPTKRGIRIPYDVFMETVKYLQNY